VVVGIAAVVVYAMRAEEATLLTVPVESGPFEIVVTNTGEIEAKESLPIMGPLGLTSARIYSVQLEHIVEEGTLVDSGDYVATLDRSEIAERIRNEEINVEESLNNLQSVQIDTALQLGKLRDNLKKLQLSIERREIELHNSQFEPPAIIESAELALKEAHMDYQLAMEEYNLNFDKAITTIRRRELDHNDDVNDLGLLNRLYKEFIIHAPQSGMVIYRKERGNKIKEGSTISARDMVVATLPDLSKLVSRCYVNEIDIRLIALKQEVRVGIDAFPEKRLTGKVTWIANVGEALPGSSAKLFEVVVDLNESDMDIRPGMTTSNNIIVAQYEGVISVPLECLHSQGDSLSFVYLKERARIIRNEVVTGRSNSNNIIIEQGLRIGDEMLLNVPSGDYELVQIGGNL
jgi:multidrug efflux pump subunit AcrA (membrane-fusion protein)